MDIKGNEIFKISKNTFEKCVLQTGGRLSTLLVSTRVGDVTV
jgi:hypothetical protein